MNYGLLMRHSPTHFNINSTQIPRSSRDSPALQAAGARRQNRAGGRPEVDPQRCRGAGPAGHWSGSEIFRIHWNNLEQFGTWENPVEKLWIGQLWTHLLGWISNWIGDIYGKSDEKTLESPLDWNVMLCVLCFSDFSKTTDEGRPPFIIFEQTWVGSWHLWLRVREAKR